MSYLGQNSKSSIGSSLEEAALKKISQLISNFHTALLPRTNNKKVFRNLTDEEEHLLINLQQNQYLHSILAGCLAVDSCLENAFENEKILTQGIIDKIVRVYQSMKTILNQFGNKSIETNKELEDPLKKLNQNFSELLKRLQKLFYADKEKLSKLLAIQLDTDLIKNSKMDKPYQSEIQNKQSSMRNQEQQKLCQQLIAYKKIINNLKIQYQKQKNYLNRQIQRLQLQLKNQDKFSHNHNLIALVQQLQYQIQTLKSERKHDQRLLSQIQDKINLISFNNSFMTPYQQIDYHNYERCGKYSRHFDQRRQKSKRSYMRGQQNMHPKTSRIRQKNKLIYDIFNQVPIRKSIIRGQNQIQSRNASINNYNKLNRQKSANNFRLNFIQEEGHQSIHHQQYKTRVQTQDPNDNIRLQRKFNEVQYRQKSRGNRKKQFRQLHIN